MSNSKKKVLIIGNGMLASLCAKHLLDAHSEKAELSFLVIDEGPLKYGSGLEVFAEKFQIPHQITKKLRDSSLERLILETVKPDIVLSLGNSQILSASILRGVDLAVNFHNSPLPAYAGSNPCSWGLYNGESSFGVTLHLMTEEIDSGDIIAQKTFAIPPGISAAQLLALSAQQGVQLFKDSIEGLLSGQFHRTPQELQKRSFYSANDRPNNGRLDPLWTQQMCAQFFAAYDYSPLQSPLGFPKVELNGKTLYFTKFRLSDGIPALADHVLTLKVQDGSIELSGFVREDGTEISLTEALPHQGLKND